MNGTEGTALPPARTSPRKLRRQRRPARPAPVPPSKEARQRAALILEVLAGSRTPTQAAQALAVSLPRYYLLETQALAGLVTACEPAARGPTPDPQRQQEALRRECQRWQREATRQQALVRAAQRSLGLLAPPSPAPATAPTKDGKKRRKPRAPVARALKAAQRLRQESAAPQTGDTSSSTNALSRS
jgi:hypothetical protein